MFGTDVQPIKEGDLYKIVSAGGHTFELYYGYYEEYERRGGEPVIIYPDLKTNPLYSADGYMVVTAVQDTCPHFAPRGEVDEDSICSDCMYYRGSKTHIDICTCQRNRKTDRET